MGMNCPGWSARRHPQYAVPLLGRVPLRCPAGRREPGPEGVGAEVPPDDEPGGTPGSQPRQPPAEQLVHLGFADPDRRVAPDLVKTDVRRYLVRRGRTHPIGHTECGSIDPYQL